MRERKVSHWWLSASLAATMLFLAAALGFASGTSENAAKSQSASSKPHFVFVTPLMANPYWDVVEKGWKDAGAKFNAQVDYVGPTQLNVNQMVNYVESAIAEKVDGIATMALNAAAMEKPIADAKAAGIPVVLVDTDDPHSQRDAYAGTSNFNAGEMAGEYLAKLMGGNATIGILTGRLDQANLVDRVNGFKKAVSKYPNMKVVDMQPDDSNLQKGITAAEAMLLANPGINAMFGSEGFGAPALGTVVKEASKVGQIKIVGFDDLPETIAYIKDGIVSGTIVQKQYVMGYLAVEYLLRLMKHQSVPKITDTGTVVLTKANLATIKSVTTKVPDLQTLINQ